MNKKNEKIDNLVATLRKWHGGSKVTDIGVRSIKDVRKRIDEEFPGKEIEVKCHGTVIIVTYNP